MKRPHSPSDLYWLRIYWFARAGMAFLWLWTAYVSWYAYPQETSLQWLHQVGIGQQAQNILLASCLLDAALGIASLVRAGQYLWTLQIGLVMGYSVIIGVGLPEFMYHPFGPLTKNLSVLAVLLFLWGMESTRRNAST